MRDEQLTFEIEAVELLAKAAKGSMRDALSLLDQAIASVEDKLSTNEIKLILGYTQQDYAIRLLQGLAKLDAQDLIQLSRKIASESGQFHYVLDELLDYLHQISIAQSLASDNPLISSRPEIRALAQQFSPEDVQLFYQIGIKGIEEINFAPTVAIGFEMTLLRMLTFRPAPKVDTPPLCYDIIAKKSENMVEISPDTSMLNHNSSLNNSDFCEEPSVEISPEEATVDLSGAEDWSTILKKLKLTGLTLTASENAEFIGKSGREITLRVAKGHQSLFTPTIINRIEEALRAYYKESIKIALTSDEPVQSSPAQQKQIASNLRQQDAELNLQNDSFFQQLRQEFSAEVVRNSLSPVKDES